MNLQATLEQRISQKTGKPYDCIVIQITDTYEKIVFLEKSEIELIKLSSASNQKVKLGAGS